MARAAWVPYTGRWIRNSDGLSPSSLFAAQLDISEASRKALVDEARAASALDHPNIGTIFGIEDTPDGLRFIVMAYYEGETLARKAEARSVAGKEAASIGLQIASGLAEAHRHNIIHRDIKPSNIILTGQRTGKDRRFRYRPRGPVREIPR